MKKAITAVIALFLLVATVSCFAIASDDAWKNNTGEINLDKMTVTGDGVSIDSNTVKITEGGDFTVTGTLDGGSIYINADDKVKLRLSGASITSSDGPAIFFDNAEKAFITITEDTENFLEDSEQYTSEDADAALFSNDDLEIKGNGSLTVTGNYKHGIASDDDLSVENGNITVNSYEHSIKVNDTLSVIGGTLTLNAKTGKGMKAEKELVIDDGDINIVTEESEGIESKGTLVINGGNININAKEDGINTGNSDTSTGTTAENKGKSDMAQPPQMQEGQQPPQMPDGQTPPEMPDGQTPPEMPDGGMRGQRGGRGMPPQMQGGQQPPEMPDGQTPPEMPDGQTPPEMPDGQQMPEGQNRGQRPENGGENGFGGGFGRIDEETAAAHAITINGGSIYIKAGGDGIDSNGSLTINGGTVIIDGPENSGNGPLDSEGAMAINGGTVITLSSSGMIQLPNNGNGQNIIRVGFDEMQSSGTTVSVKDSDGDEIMSHTAKTTYQTLIFSSPELKTDGEYTVYIDGAEKETVTVAEGLTTAGTMGGGFGGRGMGGFGGKHTDAAKQNNRSSIKVSVNGKNVNFDMNPVMKNDTTLVGIRAIMESLGLDVAWDEETETVTVTGNDTTIKMTIGSDTAYVDGKEKKLLLAPEIIGTSTMVPVRFLSEQLGMTVDWNEANQQITITK